MRSAVALTHLALFATSAQAFYPFTPKWLKAKLERESKEARRSIEEIHGTEGVSFAIKQRDGQAGSASPKQIAREAARLARKYDRRQIPSDELSDLARRENRYDILEAVDTDEENAAGIDQDGTDYSYFVEVELGSSGKELHMLIDTGAGSTWVMGSSCTTEACSLHESFGPDDSDTFEDTGEEFTITYGSGRVNGTLAEDKVSVAGMELDYKFGVASATSDDFVNFAFDGILGLSMNDGANDNFLRSIKEAGLVDKSMFGVSLHRASDGTNDGEIKFGGTNSDKYEGKISYTSTDRDNGDWAIEIEDMAYDGEKAGVGGVSAYIDTGTTFMFGPEDLVQKIHSVIPNANSADGMSYKVPCDSSADLTFIFSGVDYVLSPKDWISPKNDAGECVSNIYGQEVVQGSWLLGAAFIKNVYAVFDADKKRIGFAKHTGETSDTETSATSTVASTSTAAAETSVESQAGTLVTSPPSSVTTPPSELGQESVESTATAAEDNRPSDRPEEDTDSSDRPDSSASLFSFSRFAFTVCTGTLMALLA
jgi:hypothetical protein